MTTPHGRFTRGRARWLTLVALVTMATVAPPEAQAQGDCQFACGAVLGVTSFTVATGTVAAWSRITGGISSASQGQTIWALSFVATFGAGAAIYGPHRERAVFAAGVGAAAGALAGLGLDSVTGSGEGSTKVAAALIGAAVGALAGGVYGALSHPADAGDGALPAFYRPPLVSVRISF
jgi:hypothetical protein